MRAILQVLYYDIQSPDRGLFGWECQPCGRRDVSLLALRYGSNVSLRLCSLTSCRPFQTANLSITFFGFSSPHAPLLAPCSYCRLGGAWFHSFLPCFRSPLAKTKKSQPLGVDPSRAVVYCLDSAREGQLEAEKEDDRSSPPSASTRISRIHRPLHESTYPTMLQSRQASQESNSTSSSWDSRRTRPHCWLRITPSNEEEGSQYQTMLLRLAPLRKVLTEFGHPQLHVPPEHRCRSFLIQLERNHPLSGVRPKFGHHRLTCRKCGQHLVR